MYKLIFALFIAGFIFSGCDNELDLVADYEEFPVVYGLIDLADTAQYIRVERVFVDKNTSATILAQNPDSLYYDNITVKLVNLQSGEEHILTKVDGNEEGYVRDTGAFAQTPNFLYKLPTSALDVESEELLEIQIEGIYDEEVVSATTDIVEAPFFASPQQDGVVSFLPDRRIAIGWNPKADNSVIFTVSFYFNIREERNGVIEDKRLHWIVDAATEKTLIEAFGRDFYSFLRGNLDINEDISRSFMSCEFELIAGNQNIADYIRVGQANLGITSSGEVPKFTNMSRGLGIFGSKYTVLRTNIDLNAETLDSLRNGSITDVLNFN